MALRSVDVPKLLTPVDLGSLALSHRVVVLVPPMVGRRGTASAYTKPAPTDGLVIQTFVPDPDIRGCASGETLPNAKIWNRLNDSVRARGGRSIAQVSGEALIGSLSRIKADDALGTCEDHAIAARTAGFDGVEVTSARYTTPQTATPLLETVQVMIDVWGADRVGVQLAPFAWMTGPDDERALDVYGQLLCALAGMEIAYLHLSATVTPDRGDLSTSLLGRCLRKAFPGMLIASGVYTPDTAIAAVASRWADAIGFTLITGRGDDLLRAIGASVTGRRQIGPGLSCVRQIPASASRSADQPLRNLRRTD